MLLESVFFFFFTDVPNSNALLNPTMMCFPAVHKWTVKRAVEGDMGGEVARWNGEAAETPRAVAGGTTDQKDL